MDNMTLNSILSLLTRDGAPHDLIHHPLTRTSEESALVRGTDVRISAKALLLKADDAFHLFVISAAYKFDSRAIKSRLGVKKLRFASASELFELTGLESGAVPPFGHPVLPFDLYLEPALLTVQGSPSTQAV